MKRLGWLLAAALLILPAAKCFETREATGETLQGVGTVVQTVGSALPPPWNLVLAGVGAVVGVLGSVVAGKRKSAAFAAGGANAAAALSPLVKVFAERKWLYPTLGALVAAGKAAGIWDLSGEDLAAILTMLGIPAIGEFIADAGARVNPKPISQP